MHSKLSQDSPFKREFDNCSNWWPFFLLSSLKIQRKMQFITIFSWGGGWGNIHSPRSATNWTYKRVDFECFGLRSVNETSLMLSAPGMIFASWCYTELLFCKIWAFRILSKLKNPNKCSNSNNFSVGMMWGTLFKLSCLAPGSPIHISFHERKIKLIVKCKDKPIRFEGLILSCLIPMYCRLI